MMNKFIRPSIALLAVVTGATTLATAGALVACSSQPLQCSQAPCGGGSTDSGVADSGALDGGGGDTQTPIPTKAIRIKFAVKVGQEAFDCKKTFPGLGVSGVSAVPLDFRMYVHDVKVVDSAGNTATIALTQDQKWQYQNLALLDFEDKTGTCINGTTDTNVEVVGTVPASLGTVNAVKFIIGVPENLNHADMAVAASPLNLSSMSWDWTYGYKFLRADFKQISSAVPTTALLHLGSTGCTPGAGGAAAVCSTPNRPLVNLINFDPAKSTIVLDYAQAVLGSNLADDQGGEPGCMSDPSDPECLLVMPKLGVDVATGSPSGMHQAFRVE
jgi:uncharacterized repeat protein (TIGR04052 family)